MIAQHLALRLIRGYQRFISPYKGFSCAYRVATNDLSCSSYGAKVIQRWGVLRGYALLRRRFAECYLCSQALNEHKHTNPHLHPQRGVIDCDCGDPGDCSPGCEDACPSPCETSPCSSDDDQSCNTCNCCSAADCGTGNTENTSARLKRRVRKKMQSAQNDESMSESDSENE